jgi:hypothetical protein
VEILLLNELDCAVDVLGALVVVAVEDMEPDDVPEEELLDASEDSVDGGVADDVGADDWDVIVVNVPVANNRAPQTPKSVVGDASAPDLR